MEKDLKERKNKQSVSGTGGGPSKYYSLTSKEELVAELLSCKEAIEGIAAEELGCEDTSLIEEAAIENEFHEVSNTFGKALPKKESPENLLQRQVSTRNHSSETWQKLFWTLPKCCQN